VARAGGHTDVPYLIDLIAKHQVAVMDLLPSVLRSFLTFPGLERCRSLRHIVTGGEASTPDLVEEFHRLLGAELHNLYGPTETSIGVSHWACRREGRQSIIPIGKPLPNTQIHILDSNLRQTPVGVPGELHIGGVPVGRGYYKRPELTAERFIRDPFSGDPDARLYKTGDRARWRADGNLEFLGRMDSMLKFRGFRIELGEIEAALDRHPEIAHSAVAVRDEGIGPYLIGYVVPRGRRPLAVPDLRGFLKEILPEYMVPTMFMFLDALPFAPNGKVDRRALPAPDPAALREGVPDQRTAPRNPLEAAVAEIWNEVLGLQHAGVEADFFEAGGHSLLAVRVIARIQADLGAELKLRDLFENPTVGGLSSLIEQRAAQAAATSVGS
jgi:acyl-coenzyme A synthetase/AMP-(fatty) acid ligase/acyl carrier protein